ncbi:MAG: hypothetical protein JWO00_518 [Candidatus Parcubacteria bacterium]|nr:hypothetical protein [Candidatus Parcubacteria bacterium]
MKKKALYISSAVATALILWAGIVYVMNQRPGGHDVGAMEQAAKAASEAEAARSAEREQAAVEISSYQYTETYIHPARDFAFKYPAGFAVTPLPSGEAEAITIQSKTGKVGIQILITPVDGPDADVTSQMINDSVPDMSIDSAQEVQIGENRKGLAFLSDNPAFDGASREVWFMWRGKLYQISTYAAYDGFLKGLFGTWQFNSAAR